MQIAGKVVVITGASEGIGRALAVRCAAEGAKLALIARHEDTLARSVELCDSAPVVKGYICDVRDAVAITKTVRQIVDDMGGIDVLINNAGIWQKRAQLQDITPEIVDDVLSTNLHGTISMTQCALPYLLASDKAAVVGIVSNAGNTASAGQTVYNASKWGHKGFLLSLREELQGSSVKVLAVYQGGTDTDMFRKVGETMQQEKYTNPDDLADTIVFALTRPEKLWVNELHVNYK